MFLSIVATEIYTHEKQIKSSFKLGARVQGDTERILDYLILIWFD